MGIYPHCKPIEYSLKENLIECDVCVIVFHNFWGVCDFQVVSFRVTEIISNLSPEREGFA